MWRVHLECSIPILKLFADLLNKGICVIMHNMIIEDEGDDAAAALEYENMGDPIQLLDPNQVAFEEFIQMHQQIRHRPTHEQLKEDLIEHQWTVKGNNNVEM